MSALGKRPYHGLEGVSDGMSINYSREWATDAIISTILYGRKNQWQSVNAYIYEAVCARMQQENAMSDTPGVVKNLVRDTDPVE